MNALNTFTSSARANLEQTLPALKEIHQSLTSRVDQFVTPVITALAVVYGFASGAFLAASIVRSILFGGVAYAASSVAEVCLPILFEKFRAQREASANSTETLYKAIEEELVEDFKMQQERIRVLQETIDAKEKTIDVLKETIGTKEKAIDVLKETIGTEEKTVNALRETISLGDQKIERLKGTVETQNKMMETHDSIAVRLGERIKALLGMIEVQNQAVESWNHAEKSRGDEMEELKQTVHTVKDVLEASSEQKELQSRFALAQGQMIEKMKETIETLGEKLHLLEGQSSSHDAMKGVMNELQKTLDSCCEKGKKQEEFSLTQNRVIEGLKETIQTLGEKIHLLEEKPHNQTPSPNPLEKHPEAEPGHTVRTQFGLSPTAPETPNPHHLGGRGQL